MPLECPECNSSHVKELSLIHAENLARAACSACDCVREKLGKVIRSVDSKVAPYFIPAPLATTPISKALVSAPVLVFLGLIFLVAVNDQVILYLCFVGVVFLLLLYVSYLERTYRNNPFQPVTKTYNFQCEVCGCKFSPISNVLRPINSSFSDHSPHPEGALEHDELGRRPYANSVVDCLRHISAKEGFVISVEGAWGSGKTTTLAMIENLLRRASAWKRPIVVHFNPWLVGDRDALMRQFLSALASELELKERSKEGLDVARQLKAYSKVLDVVRLLPGAEPWTSTIKSVISAVGEASEVMSSDKVPNLQKQKENVEKALKDFSTSIVVFIDDIDRLFPSEVFEMIRIIKAVGGLPNVGYVVAWDANYVSHALMDVSVPESIGYLDKIVQVRMPLPSISNAAKSVLITKAYQSLCDEARKDWFPGQDDRLSTLYANGFSKLLQQPRDIIRVFNTVRVLEPSLREEVILSDIIGLAALKVKAPPVYELLKLQPEIFVGTLPGDTTTILLTSQKRIQQGADTRAKAILSCLMPEAVAQLLSFLFPQLDSFEQTTRTINIHAENGHIAAPLRLMIALQQYVSEGDTSLSLVRRFLLHNDQRKQIAQNLTTQNCLEFMDALADFAYLVHHFSIGELDELCLTITRLADAPPFSTRAQALKGGFESYPAAIAKRAVFEFVRHLPPSIRQKVPVKLVMDSKSLGVAMEVLIPSYIDVELRASSYYGNDDSNVPMFFICPEEDKTNLVGQFVDNVFSSVNSGEFFNLSKPTTILKYLSRLAPGKCEELYLLFKKIDPSLDNFAQKFLIDSYENGRVVFGLPKEIGRLESYCSLEQFRHHAQERLKDNDLTTSARAAWRSVVEGKLIAENGSYVSR